MVGVRRGVVFAHVSGQRIGVFAEAVFFTGETDAFLGEALGVLTGAAAAFGSSGHGSTQRQKAKCKRQKCPPAHLFILHFAFCLRGPTPAPCLFPTSPCSSWTR